MVVPEETKQEMESQTAESVAPLKKPTSRKQQILEALAHMLETNPGGRITTASLAKAVGVSEAALYRHFPSKAKMFDGLIEFIEDAVFSRISHVLQEEQQVLSRCEQSLLLLLGFAESNPGMCRILLGDALAGETEQLRSRVQQFFLRLEAQLKQILDDPSGEQKELLNPAATAGLLLVYFDGKVSQFVRSEFKQSPTLYWDEQWRLISHHLMQAKH